MILSSSATAWSCAAAKSAVNASILCQCKFRYQQGCGGSLETQHLDTHHIANVGIFCHVARPALLHGSRGGGVHNGRVADVSNRPGYRGDGRLDRPEVHCEREYGMNSVQQFA